MSKISQNTRIRILQMLYFVLSRGFRTRVDRVRHEISAEEKVTAKGEDAFVYY